MKRTNPYTRLKNIAQQYIYEIKNPVTKGMFYYETKTLNDRDTQLKERIIAARQLGYKVEVLATKEGLEFKYVKIAKNTPWELQ